MAAEEVWRQLESGLPEDNSLVDVMLSDFTEVTCTFSKRSGEKGGAFNAFQSNRTALQNAWLMYGECTLIPVNPGKLDVLGWKYHKEEEEEKPIDTTWKNPEVEIPTRIELVDVLLSDMTSDQCEWSACHHRAGAFHNFNKPEHDGIWIPYGENNPFNKVGNLDVLAWKRRS